MDFPENEWYSINDAAIRLEISQEKVEHYLETGKLLASVRLPLTMLNIMDDIESYAIGFDDVEDFDDFSNIFTTEKCEGIFVIPKYDRIRWQLDNSCDLYTNDLFLCKHCNWEHIDVFKFTESYVVRKNEIIIEEEAIQRFLNKYCDGVTLNTKTTSLEQCPQSEKAPIFQTKRPWEDENSVFFTEELATAVQVWERVFGHKPDKPKTSSFKGDIESILDARRDLGIQAKKRLGILLNPDKFGGGGRPKKNNC